jgi:hypothetical protein
VGVAEDASEDDWPIARAETQRWFATGEGTHGTRTTTAERSTKTITIEKGVSSFAVGAETMSEGPGGGDGGEVGAAEWA